MTGPLRPRTHWRRLAGVTAGSALFALLPVGGTAHASMLGTASTAAEQLANQLLAATGCQFHGEMGSDVQAKTLQGIVTEYAWMKFYITDNPNPGLRCSGSQYGDRLTNRIVIKDQRIGVVYTKTGTGINHAEAYQATPIPVLSPSPSDSDAAIPPPVSVTLAGVVTIQYQAVVANAVTECVEEQWSVTPLRADNLGFGACSPL